MTDRGGEHRPAHGGGPSWPSSRADHGARAEWIRASAAWRDTVAALRLSSREVQIVECLLDLEDDEATIAGRLGMSPHTVHAHLKRLYKKLGVTARCQLGSGSRTEENSTRIE
jgi:DNA-binding CsgD family transcriptional regulator